MSVKTGLFFVTLLIGSYAFPAHEDDMSIFFDHTDASARIVGGTVAGQVPYMVGLTMGILLRSFICGASLVTTRHVMTAAHCVRTVAVGGTVLSSVRATVGTNNWSNNGIQYSFASSIMHPDYEHRTLKNDIGFLITSSDVALTDAVGLVTLNYDFIGGGAATSVTGWGRTSTSSTMSRNLLQLSATVVEGSQCITQVAERAAQLNMHNPPPVDPQLEICTFHSDGRGVCSGDSGSPLMRADINQQIGVVSWGLPCARGAPDMFVRISAYRSWIEQTIR